MSEPMERDRTRIRVGLAMLAAVMLAAIVILAVVDNPVAKIFMVAIALFVVGRAFMFTRSLRRDATQKV